MTTGSRPFHHPFSARSLLCLGVVATLLGGVAAGCSDDAQVPTGPGAGGGAGEPGGGGDTAGGGGSGELQEAKLYPEPGSAAQRLSGVAPSDVAGVPEAFSPGLGDASGVADEGSVEPPAAPLSEFIVVDQFGYLPDAEKIAVVRDPVTEVGEVPSSKDFVPGATYRLVNAETNATELEGVATAWSAGAEHAQSGDKAWWFDFSSVAGPGVYYVLDVENNVRSDVFRIAPDIYREVMKQAVRTFYYQRAGFEKTSPYAEADWEDAASHLGAGQDTEARLYGSTPDASTQHDVSGGWYDAGDYNKYTPWTSDYVIEMLRAYSERPAAFGDDYELPGSANGVADLLDEAVFGLEHLVRLQKSDGSVISVMGLAGASPPSAATEPTVYGPPTTNATVRAAAAYAYGARILADLHPSFAAGLMERAKSAYLWAEANPEVTFYNSGKVAAGEQQSSPEDVATYKLTAALALYRLTGEASYKSFFDANYRVKNSSGGDHYAAFAWQWLGGYSLSFTDTYLDYSTLSDADASVKNDILTNIVAAISQNNVIGNLAVEQDPYMAFHADMTWGSNSIRSRTGLLNYSFITYQLDASKEDDAARGAARYVHYIHGVNPLGLVYLSQMERFGAATSVSKLYHTWFHHGSAWEDNPAPGILVGGPNSSYNYDDCCPSGCGSPESNAMCASRPSPAPTPDANPDNLDPPPTSQKPAMKAYWEFNDSWPVNSWEVTENSCGYQLAYIRLLSKFVH